MSAAATTLQPASAPVPVMASKPVLKRVELKPVPRPRPVPHAIKVKETEICLQVSNVLATTPPPSHSDVCTTPSTTVGSPPHTSKKRSSPDGRPSTPPTVPRSLAPDLSTDDVWLHDDLSPANGKPVAKRSRFALSAVRPSFSPCTPVSSPLLMNDMPETTLFHCVPPGLDEQTFNLVSRMAPNVINVMKWVRPAEVVGEAPAVWPEDNMYTSMSPPAPVAVAPKTPRPKAPRAKPGAKDTATATSNGPKGVDVNGSTMTAGTGSSTPDVPHGGISKAAAAKAARAAAKPGPTPTVRSVPSARCARCALKKKKCERAPGGACLACSKWASKAPSEDELQRRLQACKVPLVCNQRGSGNGTPRKPAVRKDAKKAANPLDQPQFFPALTLMGQGAVSPTSTIASGHSTPRQEDSHSPPLEMETPLESELGMISSGFMASSLAI